MISDMSLNSKILSEVRKLNSIRTYVRNELNTDFDIVIEKFNEIISNDEFLKMDKANVDFIKINIMKKMVLKLHKEKIDIEEYIKPYLINLLKYMLKGSEYDKESENIDELANKFVYYIFDIIKCTKENYCMIKINKRVK